MEKKYKYEESKKYLEEDYANTKDLKGLLEYIKLNTRWPNRQKMGDLVFYYFACKTAEFLVCNTKWAEEFKNYSDKVKRELCEKTENRYYLRGYGVYSYFDEHFEDDAEEYKQLSADLKRGVEFATDCVLERDIAKEKLFFEYLKLLHELHEC